MAVVSGYSGRLLASPRPTLARFPSLPHERYESDSLALTLTLARMFSWR